ncbi:MAG: hypothetical protein WCV59_05410 [Parcubacteria group bacterium]|jgi:hypothetical protein
MKIDVEVRVSVYCGKTSRIIIEATNGGELSEILTAIQGEILNLRSVDKPNNSDALLVEVFEGTIRRAVNDEGGTWHLPGLGSSEGSEPDDNSMYGLL